MQPHYKNISWEAFTDNQIKDNTCVLPAFWLGSQTFDKKVDSFVNYVQAIALAARTGDKDHKSTG